MASSGDLSWQPRWRDARPCSNQLGRLAFRLSDIYNPPLLFLFPPRPGRLSPPPPLQTTLAILCLKHQMLLPNIPFIIPLATTSSTRRRWSARCRRSERRNSAPWLSSTSGKCPKIWCVLYALWYWSACVCARACVVCVCLWVRVRSVSMSAPLVLDFIMYHAHVLGYW